MNQPNMVYVEAWIDEQGMIEVAEALECSGRWLKNPFSGGGGGTCASYQDLEKAAAFIRSVLRGE